MNTMQILKFNSNVNGNTEITIPNKAANTTGVNGLELGGKIDVTGIIGMLSIVADGNEILSTDVDGSFDFAFDTAPYGFQKEIEIEVIGTAAIDLTIDSNRR